MIKFLITDQNFDKIKSQQETTVAGITTKLRKDRKEIMVEVNSLAPFAIYKWEKDGHFAISNRLDKIEEYIQQFGCELTYTPVPSKYLNKAYVNRARDCNVEKVTRWSKVKIDSKGNIKIIPPKKQPFSIELTSKRGVRYLLKWLKKYLIIAKQEIDKNNFIPTLTGGLDTRTLTWFWRDWYQGDEYFLKAVKPDGKNDINKGKKEIIFSQQVLNRIGLKLTRKELRGEKNSLLGTFTEGGKIFPLNDLDFIYDYISLHMSKKSIHYTTKGIFPFVDVLYLQLRHPEIHYMRTLLALLLCPDLLDIPLYGVSGEPPYLFCKKFNSLISRVEVFIQRHHLRERVAKIKVDVAKHY